MRYLALAELDALASSTFRTRADHAWLTDAPPTAATWSAWRVCARL
jgi:hypothetical protein